MILFSGNVNNTQTSLHYFTNKNHSQDGERDIIGQSQFSYQNVMEILYLVLFLMITLFFQRPPFQPFIVLLN